MEQPQFIEQKISLAGFIDGSLKKSMAAAEKMAKGFAGKVANLYKAIPSPLKDAAALALKMGAEYDKALKNIRIGTGASAEQMQAYAKNLQNVFSAVPNNLEEAAGAVGDISTLLGYEGKNLENFASQMLNLSALIGGEVSGHIKAAKNALNAYSISAEQSGEYTDFLFRVTQETGISFDELAEITAKNSILLKNMGYDANSAAVFVGALSKQGISAEKIMAGLGNATKYGTEEIEDYNAAILSAKTEQEALNLATEIYGKNAAPEMVRAIRAGVLDTVGDLNEKLKTGGDTINGLRQETMGLDDKVQQLKNTLSAAFLPILEKLIEKAQKLVDNIVLPALKWWQGPNGQALIGKISEKFNDFRIGYFGSDEELKKWAEVKNLPQKADGGWVNSPVIAGEAGKEAIISLNPAYRAENLKTWAEAGEALGVNNNSNSFNMGGFVFSPNINMESGNNTNILELLRQNEREFSNIVLGAIRQAKERAY